MYAASINLPWTVPALGFWLLTIVIAYRSIAVSSTIIFALEGLSLLLVAVVAAAVIGHGGYRGQGVAAAHLVPPV